MAKIKKRKIRWEASTSQQVIGYKLYWSPGDTVDYSSECVSVGNVTELILPDDVESFTPSDGPIQFAVASVDELGNESDLITVSAPYQFSAPQAPKDLWIENADGHHTTDAVEEHRDPAEPIPLFDKRIQRMDEELAAEEAKIPMLARGALPYSSGQTNH